jgi:4-hydroxy-tetrahydrodipicolinate synthase
VKQEITGIFNILATPFDAEQQVDLPSLRRLIDFQLDKGAYGLTILGVLGEAAKLTVDERKQVMDTVMETVNGRVPVVVGTSHADKATCIALSQAAFEAGAAGVMIAPPVMDDPGDEAVLALYRDIASAVQNPIVVQDFPVVNNVIMSPELLAEMADEIIYVRHLKMEDPPLMEKTRAILACTDKLAIFGGLGGMFLLEELQAGAAGTMTGFAFTEVLVAVFEAFNAGNMAEAERIFDQYLPLIRYENQPKINLTIRKELLYRRGAIAHPALRKPFPPIDAGMHDEIGWIFKRVGITDPTLKLTF